MVAIATIANVEYQSTLIVDKPTMNTRNAAANAAIFAPEASNAITVVGAPSNASGIHMWKGTTAILTPKPATKRTIAIRAKDLESGVIVPRAGDRLEVCRAGHAKRQRYRVDDQGGGQ